MVVRPTQNLPVSITEDETGWLDQTVEAIHAGRFQELDYPQLAEYLNDMAARDRREVESRLAVLLCHLLKWFGQPDKRSRSWQSTIEEQRYELELILRSGTLRRHALAELVQVYEAARKRAAIEAGLAMSVFPLECPYTVEQLLEITLEDAAS